MQEKKIEPLEEKEEQSLIRKAQAGDSAAMMRLAVQYEPLLKRAAGQRHLRTVREDALAEAYVSFVRAVRDYDPAQGVRLAGFLKARVYGDLLTFFRRSARQWERETLVMESSESPFWELLADEGAARALSELELRAVLIPALRCLTPHERDVLRLVFREECTQKEAAARLGLSPQAVGKTKRRAVEKLRQFLRAEV